MVGGLAASDCVAGSGQSGSMTLGAGQSTI